MNSLKITLIGIISIIPVLVVAQHGSTADKQYNWSYSVNYDEDTNIIQLSKQYLDNLGRSTQSMSKNLAANKVMAVETVYDQYGRAVISTLPAPIGQDMVIRNNFITNNTGVPYSWQHFDEALLNNPAPVGKDSTNTLGIFYSSNGSEDYVATSSYPYSRMEYMADPTGRVKRTAAPGEQLKMGSGKENQMYYMFTAGELDRAYGVDSSFYCDISSQNSLHSTALTNTEIVAEKTISIDAEGTISISFISDGLTIASCVSGMAPTPSVPEQSALNTLLYAGTRSADIHLPLAKSTTLKLPLPTYRVPFGVSDDGVVDSNEINYTIMDLTTNELLQINTDYTIGSNRFVTFSGTNKHRFLRISYDYTQTKLDFFTSIGANPPNATLEYKLDYSHFSINYYDFSGRLRTNVSPKGFDYSVNGKHTEYSRYDYNPLGLLITKQMPDEGLTEFLYSDEGVLRFSQNAQQKQEDKFSYFRYDAENRIVEKGEYIENGASTYEFAGYYDEANTGTDVKTITDSVSKLFTSQTHHEHYVAYDLLASADEIPAAYSYKSNFAQSNLKGKVSKTWNENHQTWYSYDYAGRLTFTVQELLDTNFNTDVDETIKTVNYTYAPVTSVILKEEYQKYHATEKITTSYTYNANTQPITVGIKDAANQTIGQADFEYYLNGQLKRKTLGHHLQGIDYVYTLTGALKSMNHPTLETAYDPGSDSPVNNGIPEDLFAFALDYHENDYVRTGSNVSAIVQDGYYNGLIKAVRWKIKDENEIYQSSGNIELYNNTDPDISLMYQYTYDKFYRLETANFGVFNGSDFTAEEHYQVYGGSGNSGIDYDMIGNIKTLKRNGFSGDYDLLMDDLEYTYTSGTSQLAEVTDNSISTYSNDFNTDNGSTFLYNENGQMTAAYPDEVDSILYYPSGLIKQLINSNGDTISYTYNEQGKKIKTIFVDVQNNPNITTSTWYFTDAMGKVHGVYEKIDTAAVSLTAEVLYAGGRLAVVSDNLVNYELTDHLGNVRVTFADTSSTSTPKLMVTSWKDYYPFGEVLPGRSSNPEGHLFGYQGQQKAANNSKWYAFQLRMYNPSLGRWNSTDPYYQHHSPYLAMANNPVSFVDPDGGRAVLTETQKYAILRRIYLNRRNMSRIDYLRVWLGATGMNSYRGITFEGIYSILNGTAKGIYFQDRYPALNAYLSALGGGFLDGGSDGPREAISENHQTSTGTNVFIDGLPVSAIVAEVMLGNDNFTRKIDPANSSSNIASIQGVFDQTAAFYEANGMEYNAQEGEYGKVETQYRYDNVGDHKGDGLKFNTGKKVWVSGAKTASYSYDRLKMEMRVNTNNSQLSYGATTEQASYTALTNTQNFLTGAGAGLYVGQGVLNYGANASPLRGTGTLNLAKEAAAGRYFTKSVAGLKFISRKIPYVSAGISLSQWSSGQQDLLGLTYDGLMIGIGFAPGIGIPISIAGSIYKDEMVEAIRNSKPIKPDWVNHGYCFIAGSEVLMYKGNSKKIETIIIGDTILTYNLLTNKIEPNIVLQIDTPIHINFVEINFLNGIKNTNTPDHPYYVKGKGWSSVAPMQTKQNYELEVAQLEKGDTCLFYDKLINDVVEVVITSILPKKQKNQTYNLSKVANNSNFFVNGILVHNKLLIEELDINQKMQEDGK